MICNRNWFCGCERPCLTKVFDEAFEACLKSRAVPILLVRFVEYHWLQGVQTLGHPIDQVINL
eukprot:SAG31_NODE_26847_length_435_cov_1.074405_1_plen_62_part_10